jgi:hypothetical protein
MPERSKRRMHNGKQDGQMEELYVKVDLSTGGMMGGGGTPENKTITA